VNEGDSLIHPEECLPYGMRSIFYWSRWLLAPDPCPLKKAYSPQGTEITEYLFVLLIVLSDDGQNTSCPKGHS